MMKLIAPLTLTVLLGACATTGTATISAEERAQCARMAEQMSTASQHDHNEEKGMGRSAMNRKHDRCRQILDQGQPAG